MISGPGPLLEYFLDKVRLDDVFVILCLSLMRSVWWEFAGFGNLCERNRSTHLSCESLFKVQHIRNVSNFWNPKIRKLGNHGALSPVFGRSFAPRTTYVDERLSVGTRTDLMAFISFTRGFTPLAVIVFSSLHAGSAVASALSVNDAFVYLMTVAIFGKFCSMTSFHRTFR